MTEESKSYELPELNVDLLSDLVTWAWADEKKRTNLLKKFPGWGSWNQDVWAQEKRNGVCQTAFCIAGQAVMQSGYALDYGSAESDSEYVYDDTGNYVYENGRAKTIEILSVDACYPAEIVGWEGKDNKIPIYKATGPSQGIETTAGEALGLNEMERDALFDGTNEIEDVIAIATAIAQMRGLELNLSPKIKREITNYDYYSLPDKFSSYWLAEHGGVEYCRDLRAMFAVDELV